MPQEILRQGNWNAGEVDPQLIARKDLKPYYNASAQLENLLPTAQGPVRRRPGTAYVSGVRAPLQAVPYPGDTVVTAPNGGDTSSATNTAEASALVSTTAMAAVPEYVVLELDFSAPVSVSAVDLVGYAAVPAGTDSNGVGPQPSKPTYPWNPPGYRYYIP